MKNTKPRNAMSLRKLEANYKREIIDEARLEVALRRAHPGCTIRFQRAAQTGPHADKTLVAVYRAGGEVTVTAVSNEFLDRLRERVTEAEALAVLDSRAARTLDADPEEE